MAILSFATGAIDPSTAMSKGLPFYRIRKSLPLTATHSDFFNINVPVVAAYVGPESSFDRYVFGNLSSLFGTQGGSYQPFNTQQGWLPRVLFNEAPNMKLGAAGMTLGFTDNFDLTANPFVGSDVGSYESFVGSPIVDVYLWLVEPPHPPFLRAKKVYITDEGLVCAAGVETTVLFQPTWGRSQVSLKLPAGSITQRTFNVYGGNPRWILDGFELISTIVQASTDPADSIDFPDWSHSVIKVTETAVAEAEVGIATLWMQDSNA